MYRPVELLLLAITLLAAGPVAAESGQTLVYDAPLRVCADPDNLPYSSRDGAGFENKLAQMVADDLGTTVDYTWFAQRTGFLRATLNAGECDVVMGYPAASGVLSTRAYYRSGFVFVTRRDRDLAFTSMKDSVLRSLRIGVQIVGGDGAATAPTVALGREGLSASVEGFPVYGRPVDGIPAAAAPMVAVERGDIDVAAVWGPIAGYYAARGKVPLRVTPITDTSDFLPEVFSYPISMALRPDEADLRDRLDRFIATHKSEIAALLESYGVPLL